MSETLLKFPQEDQQYQVVLDIAGMLRRAGGRALLVGGCVRDAIQGIVNKDYDVEVYGLSAERLVNLLSSRYELSLVGMSFGVIKLHHFDIDVALPRLENKTGAGHRGFIVEMKSELSFRDAASRRDFTLNSIMYDPLEQKIIDPFNGVADLRTRILRHNTDEHFGEDPLRVLRTMQFVARFGFQVAPDTIDICRALNQDELPTERIAGEWEKMLLKGSRPSLGLRFLADCGWIRFYPELKALIGCRQNPQWHPEGDVWEHTLRCLDASVQFRTHKHDDDLAMTLGVLCHDLGKPATSILEDGKITSKGHPEAGEPIAFNFIMRIWNQPDLALLASKLVRHHMEPFFMAKGGAGNAAYRRLALDVKRMDLLYKVACCDMRGITRDDITDQYLDIFMARANELAILDSTPKPIVLGRHLLKMGMKPGPHMGKVLDKCFDAQLEGFFTDLEGGLDFARSQLDLLAQSGASENIV